MKTAATFYLYLSFAIALAGCSLPPRATSELTRPTVARPAPNQDQSTAKTRSDGSTETAENTKEAAVTTADAASRPQSAEIKQVGFESPAVIAAVEPSVISQTQTSSTALALETVLSSVVENYPEIQAAFLLDEFAAGQQQTAAGSFDSKFKLNSDSTPVGFYETYRNQVGLELPTFNGGALFGGYRLGRGDFEPWYLERNTNAGGEFKVGLRMALARGRQIDQRRAELWKANWRRRIVEPEIQLSLIAARQAAEITYWSWVAAGQVFRLNQKIFEFAEQRQEGLRERIEAGDLADIDAKDNERTIVSRRAKLIQSRAKFEQAAAKLSLFYRDANGQPVIPNENQMPGFPTTELDPSDSLDQLLNQALQCRPEIRMLDFEQQRLRVDLAKAKNDLLPRIDFELATSQDVGRPTSASAAASSSGAVFANFDEKDQLKVDASISVDQTLERRKARGKIRSVQAKSDQLHIKRAFLEEKIKVAVTQSRALLEASRERSNQARLGKELARELADAARRRYAAGDIDLFELILRERQEVDAANEFVDAMFDLYAAQANLEAAIGCAFLN